MLIPTFSEIKENMKYLGQTLAWVRGKGGGQKVAFIIYIETGLICLCEVN